MHDKRLNTPPTSHLYLLRHSAIKTWIGSEPGHREGKHMRLLARAVALICLPLETHLNMELLLNIFSNYLPIEQVNNTMGIVGIIWRVRYHNDRCSFFIKLR